MSDSGSCRGKQPQPSSLHPSPRGGPLSLSITCALVAHAPSRACRLSSPFAADGRGGPFPAPPADAKLGGAFNLFSAWGLICVSLGT